VAFVELLVLDLPLVLVSEPPFSFLDVLPLIAKAGEARVLAVISTIAVTMVIIAKVVVFIYTTNHLELMYIKNCLTMLTVVPTDIGYASAVRKCIPIEIRIRFNLIHEHEWTDNTVSSNCGNQQL
jgi:hypothetical protein